MVAHKQRLCYLEQDSSVKSPLVVCIGYGTGKEVTPTLNATRTYRMEYTPETMAMVDVRGSSRGGYEGAEKVGQCLQAHKLTLPWVVLVCCSLSKRSPRCVEC